MQILFLLNAGCLVVLQKDSVILDKGGNADNKIAADVLPEDLIKNLEDVFNLLNVQAPEADEKSIDDQDGKSHP